jgi:hypothetical protein
MFGVSVSHFYFAARRLHAGLFIISQTRKPLNAFTPDHRTCPERTLEEQPRTRPKPKGSLVHFVVNHGLRLLSVPSPSHTTLCLLQLLLRPVCLVLLFLHEPLLLLLDDLQDAL